MPGLLISFHPQPRCVLLSCLLFWLIYLRSVSSHFLQSHPFRRIWLSIYSMYRFSSIVTYFIYDNNGSLRVSENKEGEIYGGLENEFQLETLAAGLRPDTDSTSRKIDISWKEVSCLKYFPVLVMFPFRDIVDYKTPSWGNGLRTWTRSYWRFHVPEKNSDKVSRSVYHKIFMLCIFRGPRPIWRTSSHPPCTSLWWHKPKNAKSSEPWWLTQNMNLNYSVIID